MKDVTNEFFYKKEIIDLLELEENKKYSLLFVYLKFKDFINNITYKKIFKSYRNVEFIKYHILDKEDKLINYIHENFTIKMKYNKIDKGIIIKNIVI